MGLLMKGQIKFVANVTVVLRSSAAGTSVLTLKAARRLLEATFLALVADEPRGAVTGFVLGLRTNAVVDAKGQRFLHALDGIADGCRAILTKLSGI